MFIKPKTKSAQAKTKRECNQTVTKNVYQRKERETKARQKNANWRESERIFCRDEINFQISYAISKFVVYWRETWMRFSMSGWKICFLVVISFLKIPNFQFLTFFNNNFMNTEWYLRLTQHFLFEMKEKWNYFFLFLGKWKIECFSITSNVDWMPSI